MAQLLFMAHVAEAEPYVAELRSRFDPSAKRGLPAHITLLHAPLPAGGIDPSVIGRVPAAIGSMAPFSYQLTRVARFPGTVYLAAEPIAPFAWLHDRLATAMMAGSPETQERKAFVPHVSVVRKSQVVDYEVESELSAVLQRVGPIACACHMIGLLENSSGSWQPVQAFALTGGTGSPAPAPF
jgi:2'-5' RNA ligase